MGQIHRSWVSCLIVSCKSGAGFREYILSFLIGEACTFESKRNQERERAAVKVLREKNECFGLW